MRRTSVRALVLFALVSSAVPAAGQIGPGGGGALADSGHVLFVGLESEDAVAVVDPAVGEVLKKIPVGVSSEDIEGVHALATSPERRGMAEEIVRAGQPRIERARAVLHKD